MAIIIADRIQSEWGCNRKPDMWVSVKSPTRCVWSSQFTHKVCVPVRVTEGGFTLGKPGRSQVVTARETVQEKPSGYTVSWEVTVEETTPVPSQGHVSSVEAEALPTNRKCHSHKAKERWGCMRWQDTKETRQDNTIWDTPEQTLSSTKDVWVGWWSHALAALTAWLWVASSSYIRC